MIGITNKSETAIANMSLRHLGISKEIGDLLSEKSKEAAACRRFYDQCIYETHRDYPHPFSTEIVTLNLIEENPNSEWSYSYRYPSECEFFRRILSGTRNDTRASRVPYRVSSDSTARLILTDMAQAEAEITKLITNPILYPFDFISMVSFLLAFYISPSVTRSDVLKLGNRAYEMYLIGRDRAIANAENEQQSEEPPESEFMSARE